MPTDGCHHAERVRAAWWYVRAYPLPEAIARFAAALRQFALSRGKPERYHETITIAFLLVIAERASGQHATEDWNTFAAHNPDILTWKPSVLDG
jgi:hypothetical protein